MKKLAVSMFGCLFFLASCVSDPPKPDVALSFRNIDEFQNELAVRARTALGEADDFQVVVTQAAFPIGTLMRIGSTIPIDYTACLPQQQLPNKSAAPSLFPTYGLTKTVAVDFGLDNEVIKKLLDFEITVKDTDQITLAVKTPHLQVLADNDIKRILTIADCQSAIPKSSAWLVRGYILGQRNFTLKSENANNVKGKIEKIASFNIDVGSGNQSVTVTDESETAFLQIVSQLNPQTTGLLAAVEQPKQAGGKGRVYIQRDRQDASKNAESVATALQTASFNVEQRIERIDSSRMPKLPQVRYFNETDKTMAEKALGELKKFFPAAILVRVGLPAPPEQIEVWLPRIAG